MANISKFEKEAEEWVENNLHSTEEDYIKAFKDGAEFGYNKANEWHYVKDEGTPKVKGYYLVCLRNKDRNFFDCWIYYYDKDVGWYSSRGRIKYIYAWKEIVLPKESE